MPLAPSFDRHIKEPCAKVDTESPSGADADGSSAFPTYKHCISFPALAMDVSTVRELLKRASTPASNASLQPVLKAFLSMAN
jgi:hypothetical protein